MTDFVEVVVSIVGAVTGLWLAFVATIALSTWKHQSKAQRQTDFLDQLTEATHTLIGALNMPIATVAVIRIGIDSHRPRDGNQVDGAVAYIRAHGDVEGTRLGQYLTECTRHIEKVNSLVAKGQVLGFGDYQRCVTACYAIGIECNRMIALSSMLISKSLNWNHPEVRSALSVAIKVDPEEIKKAIGNANVELLRFVKDNFVAILK